MQNECIGYLVGGGLALGSALLLMRKPRLRLRTIDEVEPFLYDPNEQTFFQSLDATADMLWRRQSDRRVQWARMLAFRKSLGLQYDNVRVIYEAALAEKFDSEQHEIAYAVEKTDRVIGAAQRYFSLVLPVRIRLHVAGLSHFHKLSFMPVPKLAAFSPGRNLIDAYREVGRAGHQLATLHGESEMQSLMSKIRLCFWMA